MAAQDVLFRLRMQGQQATQAGFLSTGKSAAKSVALIGVAAAGVGKALFDVGAAFDDAYDTIRVGTGATGGALEKLKDDFRSVAANVPASFGDVSTAVADLNTRLGLTGRPLRGLSAMFLELSRITKTDVGTNIKTVTRAFGDWEVKTTQQGNALDKFFRAAQGSGATVSELAEQVVKFGAPLRQVGFSLDEATAMFANFEKAGVNTSTMMPGIKQAMKTFFEEGVDPKKGLNAAFKGIQDGSIDAAEAIKIFGTRAGGDMIEAVKQGRFELDGLTKALRNGDDTILKAGQDTMDFAEHWQVFKNKTLLKLEPVAIRVFDGLGKLMEVLPPKAGQVKDAISTILSPLVAVGKAVTESKTAMIALSPIAIMLAAHFARLAAVAAFSAVLRGLTAGFWLLNAAMRANPIMLAVTALSLLAAGLVVAYRKSSTFRGIVNAVWGALKTGFGWVKSQWPTIKNTLTAPISAAVGFIKNLFGGIPDFFRDRINSIIDLANSAGGLINKVLPGDPVGQIGRIMGPSSATSAAASLGRRAAGGPVSAGKPYVVNERGVEVLQMGGQSGYIHSADSPAAAGGGMSEAMIMRIVAAVMRRLPPTVVQINGREIARANAMQLADEAAFT